MIRSLPLVIVAVAVAACATPPDRLEAVDLRPVPRSAAIAEAAGAGSPPAVLRRDEVSQAAKIVEEVRTRGSASIEDCLRLAEATQEDLLSGDEDRLQAALRRDLAVAGIMPSFSLSAYTFVQDRVPSTDTGGGGSFSTSADREQWAITVRQPIFKGFAEFSAMRAADRTEESRRASIETMRAALRRSVARAFFGVLQAEAETRTLEADAALDRTRIAEMRARLENGLARRSEVLLLESQLQGTLATLLRARTRHAVTRTTLDQLLGVELPAPLAYVDAAPVDVPTRQAALAEALRSRPELRATGLSALAAEASVDVARSGYWPTVSLLSNWYLGRSGVSPFTKSTDWDAQVAVEFPFFEGGATRAKERAAKSDVRKARLAESAAVRSVVQDVESVLARLATDLELLATFERDARIAEENLGILREEYSNGISTTLEVLSAQNTFQEAQLEVERQRLFNRLDRVELSIALGRTEIDR